MMKKLLLAILFFTITGCVQGKMMPIPDHPPLQKIDLAGKKTATIAFERAFVSVPVGTTIFLRPAHMPNPEPDVSCNRSSKYENLYVDWKGEGAALKGWDAEAGKLFYATMKEAGISVTGNPLEPFRELAKKNTADFRVAAEIATIYGNMCDAWNAPLIPDWLYRLNKEAGEAYMEVVWTVYDPASQKKVGTFRTYGYGVKTVPSDNGMMAVFNSAFANATANLAATPAFIEFLASTDGEKVRQEDLAKYDTMTIRGVPKSRRSAAEMTTVLTRATVVLRSATSHGSGFIISPEGYILTAAHVVGESGKVTAKFDNGLELPAEVVRTNAYRDAALLKVDVKGLTPVPIEAEALPKVLEEVYAVGTPLKEELNVTMTRGVVSALREKDEAKDLLLIQSDVGISGGNSGGPLVDKAGNAVGIAVSGIGLYQLNAGINFFVPVPDALKYLKITVTQEKEDQ